MAVTRQVTENTGPKETGPELKSRLNREDQEAAHRQWKDRMMTWFVFFVMAYLLLALTVLAAQVPESRTSLQNLAVGSATAIVSAVVAYHAGRQAKDK